MITQVKIMDKRKTLKYKIGPKLAGTGNLSKVFAIQAFVNSSLKITPEQFSVLHVLVENGCLYQRQISALTLKDRPNISRILNILEGIGYITKTPDVNKRKIVKINITQKGIDVYNKAVPTILNVWDETVEGIPEKELDMLDNLLEKINNNLLSKVNIQI